MKYCSKCGNEMLDEAVVCVKCGCPVESATNGTDKIIKANKRLKIETAVILNIIAFFVSIIVSIIRFINTYNFTQNETTENIVIQIGNERPPFNITLFIVYCGFIILTFILGIVAKNKLSQEKNQRKFVYLYLGSAILTQILLFVPDYELIGLIICGIGFLFFIPLLLQIIAAVKFIQYSNE